MYKKQFIFMVMILVLFSNWALAKELGVTITKISGACEVMRVGELEWIKAEVNMRLYLNDRIRTKLISKATFKFDDGTIIDMEENTTIDIKELFEAKWTGRTKFEMKLWIGEISGTIEKLKTKDSEFNIHTPVAIIGIRGTKIKVKVDSKGKTTCYVREGKAQMRGIKESEDKWTSIKANEYSTCITGDEVTSPEKFKPVPPEEKEKKIEEKIEPLSEILKKRKEILKEGRISTKEKLPPQERVEKPLVEVEKPVVEVEKPLPSPKINAQFPEQNKPFINKIPDVTIFISLPTIKDREKIPTCFLQIEDNIPIELPRGANKYRFRPSLLKPGANKLIIKAWYKKGQVASTVVHFPFYDPYPPIIREKKVKLLKLLEPKLKSLQGTKTITQERIHQVEVFVSVTDLDSGIREVIANDKRMENIKEENYKIILYLQKLPANISTNRKEIEKIKLRVIDRADNVTTEIIDYEFKKIEDKIRGKLER